MDNENRHLPLVPTPEKLPRSKTEVARGIGLAILAPWKELKDVFFPKPIELPPELQRQIEAEREQKRSVDPRARW